MMIGATGIATAQADDYWGRHSRDHYRHYEGEHSRHGGSWWGGSHSRSYENRSYRSYRSEYYAPRHHRHWFIFWW